MDTARSRVDQGGTVIYRLVISSAAGLLAGYLLFHWRSFPFQFAAVIGMMIAFFVYHVFQASDRLKEAFRKDR